MKRSFVPQLVLALAPILALSPLHAGAQPPAPVTPSAPAPTAAQPAPQVTPPATAIEYPASPEPGVYVSDRAAILSIDATKQINKASAEIFLASGVPVFVVTIRSVEHMGGDAAAGAAGVEQYARDLFNRWGVGTSQDNRGVLILCSRGDSAVRLQLGKGWPASADATAGRIVNDIIVPPFQRSSAAEGLLAGVKAVGVMIENDTAQRFPDRVARQSPTSPVVPIPPPSPLQAAPTWVWIGVGVIVLIVVGFIALLLKARGSGEG